MTNHIKDDYVLYSAALEYAEKHLALPTYIPSNQWDAVEWRIVDDLLDAIDAGKLTISVDAINAVAEDDTGPDYKLNWYCEMAASYILSRCYYHAYDSDGYERAQ